MEKRIKIVGAFFYRPYDDPIDALQDWRGNAFSSDITLIGEDENGKQMKITLQNNYGNLYLYANPETTLPTEPFLRKVSGIK